MIFSLSYIRSTLATDSITPAGVRIQTFLPGKDGRTGDL